MIFKYVLIDAVGKAMPIHTEKTYVEIEAYIKKNSKKADENSKVVFVYNGVEYIDPKIKLPGEFIENSPAWM